MGQVSSSIQKSQTTPPIDSYDFKVIFEAALEAYKETTKQSLEDHALFTQLQKCDTPAAILELLQGQIKSNPNEGLKRWLKPTINVLYAFSATLGEGVGLIFPPATVIFAGVGILLLAAKDLNEDQGTLVEILEQIENFFKRLEIYTDVPPTPAMKDTMVKIMVEILDILAIATKETKRSRAKRFLKKLAGRTDMQDALKRLDKLSNEEAQMARAQVLKNTHVISNKLTAVDSQVNNVRSEVQGINSNVDSVKRNKLWEDLRKWQSPPDLSRNHNFAGDRQLEGTAEWFFRGGIFEQWMVTGSLLWIHGKPGSGKSVLCSAIIKHISTLCDAGSASMAYFYFDFQEIDKQSRRNLIPSLLIQLSTRSDPCRDILSHLYKAHDNGARQPNDRALTQCLKEMLTLPDQGPVYLILDALDECPNTSEIPSTRRRVLDLVKDLVGLQLPNLHICMTSRPEIDIRDVIEPLALHSVSLHEENGQIKDITAYVKSVIYSDSGAAMSRWRAEEKELAIETLSNKADGMFRWVYCQLEALQNCLPRSLRKKLSELPKTLDETYERMLKELRKADGDLARRILQCLAVAMQPLRVEELAEVLALDFDETEGGLPKFEEKSRLQDPQRALLITCSSLISISVDEYGFHFVQFSHFSVKEFLTSDRPSMDFRILPEHAHAILAQACLEVLLRLDANMGNRWIRDNFPLAGYAAAHWVDHWHAQIEKVSLRVGDGMQRLFDQSKPHFTAWLGLHDIDYHGYRSPSQAARERRRAPLYYASLCGFRDLVEHLVVKNPRDVNARVGRHQSPLAAALHNRHFHVAEFLCQHHAVMELASHNNRTLLVNGHVEAVKWLLERGANVNFQQNDGPTSSPEAVRKSLWEHPWKSTSLITAAINHGDSPLHLASAHDRFETVQLLIQCGADVAARNNSNSTPLHLALSKGGAKSVQLLIEHGADVNARDEWSQTPLHRASPGVSAESMELLISHGADVNSRDLTNVTPLHLALADGFIPDARHGVVKVLIRHGADVNAQDANNSTPLHRASSSGNAESMHLLIQHGANVNALDKKSSSPLHLALSTDDADSDTVGRLWNARTKAVEVLIRHKADVNARDENNLTPLHWASSGGRTESMELLIMHGAEVNARDKKSSTPLHMALTGDYYPNFWIYRDKVVEVLVRHRADVNARDENNSTPLHLASSKEDAKSMELLIQHGADVNARDKSNSTPLHLASTGEPAKVLIQHGADVNTRNNRNLTPLHLASSRPRPEIEIVRLLLEHGAAADAKDEMGRTPYELALSTSESQRRYRSAYMTICELLQSSQAVQTRPDL